MPKKISLRDRYSGVEGVDKAQEIANRYEQRANSGSKRNLTKIIVPVVLILIVALGYYYVYSNNLGGSLNLTYSIITLVVIIFLFWIGSKIISGHTFLAISFFAMAIILGHLFYPSILNSAAAISPTISNSLQGVIQKAQQTLAQNIPKELQSTFSIPQTQAPAQTTLNAQFSNPVNSDPLSVTADISIKTPNSLILKYSCLLDGAVIEANPQIQSVEGSSGQQQFAVNCLSPKGGKQLSLKVTSQYDVKTFLTVAITAGDPSLLGIKSSTMLYDGPYALSLDLNSAQPLAKRVAGYPLNIKFFKKESGANLISIDSFDLSAVSSLYSLSCNPPLSSLSFNADRATLNKLGDKINDNYVFPCSLSVNNIPEKGFEQSFINAKASYTIEKEFKTALSNSASVA